MLITRLGKEKELCDTGKEKKEMEARHMQKVE